MRPQSPGSNFILYILWLVLTGWTMTLHWLYPFIVFALGAVVLHNSSQGGLLRRLIERVRVWRNVSLRRAQQLTFAAGIVLVALALPVVAATSRQAEDRKLELQRQEVQAAESRRSAALAERQAAEAKAAAARAETERLIAQKRASNAEAAAKRQAAQDQADRQAQVDREAQAKRDADQRARDQQVQQQRDTQLVVDKEVARRAAEGPYTSSDVERMCKQAVGEKFGIDRSAVTQKGSFFEQMDAMPKNIAFGQGRLWFWRPTLEIVGAQGPFEVLCRVHDDGQVEVVDS